MSNPFTYTDRVVDARSGKMWTLEVTGILSVSHLSYDGTVSGDSSRLAVFGGDALFDEISVQEAQRRIRESAMDAIAARAVARSGLETKPGDL